jgi:hypothetical protein
MSRLKCLAAARNNLMVNPRNLFIEIFYKAAANCSILDGHEIPFVEGRTGHRREDGVTAYGDPYRNRQVC